MTLGLKRRGDRLPAIDREGVVRQLEVRERRAEDVDDPPVARHAHPQVVFEGGNPSGFLRPEEMTDAEGIGLVADEPQPREVILVQPEDALVGADVVKGDVHRVPAGWLGEKPVQASDDARRAGQRIEVDDALQPE